MEIMAVMRTVLVSTGVVSMAVVLKLSLPMILDLVATELSFSWYRPPYLYLIINCIIISILASSKLQSRGEEVAPEEKIDVGGEIAVKSAAAEDGGEDGGARGAADEVAAAALEEVVVKEVVFGYVDESDLDKEDSEDVVKAEEVVVVEERGGGDVEEREGFDGGEEEERTVVMRSMWTLPEDVVAKKTTVAVEKPPVSARFAHRKAVKASPEGKARLKKVSRPKRQETLESTWRTLTEGRPMPLTRHLRKSDTFAGTPDSSPPIRVMKKSDTFPAAPAGSSSPGSAGSSGGGRLKRESSMSQDELNRRVEAFIKKFNEEMRLQRQESINQYKHMSGRY